MHSLIYIHKLNDTDTAVDIGLRIWPFDTAKEARGATEKVSSAISGR